MASELGYRHDLPPVPLLTPKGAAVTERSVTIIGAGVAGTRVASALRKRQFHGRVTLLGAESHLPYDKPPLSKKLITGETQLHEIYLADDAALTELDVDYRPSSRVVALDPEAGHLRMADGSELAFDQLVIASGATPRQLPGTESAANVFTVRTVEDSLRIRDAAKDARQACVIGGGVLGAEIAASLRTCGLEVTIVELGAGLLPRALPGTAVAAALLELHTEAGVAVRTGTAVRSVVQESGAVTGLHLDDGTTLETDLVVAALGIRPDTDWLEGSGLEVADGLICDQFLQTNRQNVYGVGDAVRVRDSERGTSERAEHWTNAVEQAEVVAQNLLAATEDRIAFRPAPYLWSDQHGERIQVIGTAQGFDVEEVLRHPSHPHRVLSLFGTGGQFTGAAAIGMPRPIARLRPRLATPTDFATALELARSLV
jgi:3-phenylpropionate/trans-cinnamate dioxygenase ferredoxin reductase subunit